MTQQTSKATLLNRNMCMVHRTQKPKANVASLKLLARILRGTFSCYCRAEDFENIVDNLNSTQDRKSREKSKSASKNRDLSLKGCLLVLTGFYTIFLCFWTCINFV